MIKTIQIHVAGRVQGVCFRAATQKTATKMQVDGWVTNLTDGRVKILARAEDDVLERFIAWCHKGPTFAKVTCVTVDDMPENDVSPGFTIE